MHVHAKVNTPPFFEAPMHRPMLRLKADMELPYKRTVKSDTAVTQQEYATVHVSMHTCHTSGSTNFAESKRSMVAY